jgi:hypothetical protein
VTSDGRWIENDARWFELRMVYCDLCGRVIPKHLWRASVNGVTRTFCEPACEGLYQSYLLGSEGPPHSEVRRSTNPG